MFNAVLAYRCVPSAWRQGIVVHLPKGGGVGDRSKLVYRTVTLLPLVDKLFAKLASERIAHDSGAHAPLLHRLLQCGVTGHAFAILLAMFSSASSRVHIGSALSPACTVQFGVAQGFPMSRLTEAKYTKESPCQISSPVSALKSPSFHPTQMTEVGASPGVGVCLVPPSLVHSRH